MCLLSFWHKPVDFACLRSPVVSRTSKSSNIYSNFGMAGTGLVADNLGTDSWAAWVSGQALDYNDSDDDSVDSEMNEHHNHGDAYLTAATTTELKRIFDGGGIAESFQASQRDIPLPIFDEGTQRSVRISQEYLSVNETGGAVYDSALVLVDYLLSRGHLEKLSGRPAFAIELGTGPGFISVALALAGVRVLATDGEPSALQLSRRNCEENKVLAGSTPDMASSVQPMLLQWGNRDHIAQVVATAKEAVQGTDVTPLVVLSDVLYPGSDLDALAETIRDLAEGLGAAFCMSHIKRIRAREIKFLRHLVAEHNFEIWRTVRWGPCPSTSLHSFYIHCFRKRSRTDVETK